MVDIIRNSFRDSRSGPFITSYLQYRFKHSLHISHPQLRQCWQRKMPSKWWCLSDLRRWHLRRTRRNRSVFRFRNVDDMSPPLKLSLDDYKGTRARVCTNCTLRKTMKRCRSIIINENRWTYCIQAELAPYTLIPSQLASFRQIAVMLSFLNVLITTGMAPTALIWVMYWQANGFLFKRTVMVSQRV